MQNCYFPQVKTVDACADTKKNGSTLTRVDGRGADELRACFMRCGVLSAAAGSAYVEMGQTRVLCAVYGPRSDPFSKGKKLVCELKLNGQNDTQNEMELGNIMKQALEPSILMDKLPKCQISIHAVVLEGDGAELSAAITCASLALVDAGVEMIDMVSASSAAMLSDNNVVLDPNAQETAKEVMVAFMPARGQVTHVIQKGKMPYTKVQEAVELCTDCCAGVLNTMMRACVIQGLKSEL